MPPGIQKSSGTCLQKPSLLITARIRLIFFLARCIWSHIYGRQDLTELTSSTWERRGTHLVPTEVTSGTF